MKTLTIPKETLVKCETCERTYAAQSNAFVQREVDVETVGLACPHCGAHVVAYRTNGAIRKLQAKAQEERQKADVKIRARVPANRAERRLRQARAKLQAAFAAFNGR